MSDIETRDVELTELRTDAAAGTFTGLAAGYDNRDGHGTTLRRGAFAGGSNKSRELAEFAFFAILGMRKSRLQGRISAHYRTAWATS